MWPTQPTQPAEHRVLTIAIVIGFAAFFVGFIAVVVRLSGRRFPGDITGDQGNAVDYDDYHVGWNIFSKPNLKAPPAGDDFAKWEAEQRRRRG